MKFAQLLQKYKDDTATPEERELVEEELEKNELINEYLSGQILSSVHLPDEASSLSLEKKQVRRSVNKRFWKTTLLSISMLLALVLLLIYVALPLYNSLFYDPLKASLGVPDILEDEELLKEKPYLEMFHPFYITTMSFLELHCPGQVLMNADVHPLNFGNYRVRISTLNTFDGTSEYIGEIHHGNSEKQPFSKVFFQDHLIPSGAFYDKGPHNVAFLDENGIEHFEQEQSTRTYYRDCLNELPKSTYLSAYISFNQDMSTEDLLRLSKQWDDCTIQWAAVRISEDDWFREFGFGLFPHGYAVEVSDKFDEAFPSFSLAYRGDNPAADIYETHFKSLLRYMTYQKDYLHAMANINNYEPQLYQDALDYVEQNGIKIYGVLVHGSRDSLIELEKQDYVHSFKIDDVKLSLIG